MAFQPKAHNDMFPRFKDEVSKEIGGVGEDATAVMQNFGKKVEGGMTTLSKAHTAVTAGAKKYAQGTYGYVRANPWKAAGIAAIASLVIGFLLSRR